MENSEELQAERILAKARIEAATILAKANTEISQTEHFSREDRDLLITMHEQIRNVRQDIKDMKDGTATKLGDHENRLRRVELWGGIALGVSYALTFYMNYIK